MDKKIQDTLLITVNFKDMNNKASYELLIAEGEDHFFNLLSNLDHNTLISFFLSNEQKWKHNNSNWSINQISTLDAKTKVIITKISI